MPRRALLRATLTVLLVIVTAPVPMHASNELERHLRDKLQGKTLFIRNFYSGSQLDYDSSGMLRSGSAPGDWTVDGAVQITDVHLSAKRLKIQARRVWLGWVGNTGLGSLHNPKNDEKEQKEEKEAQALLIDIDLGSEATPDKTDMLLSKVFLTAEDNFADLVPEYWKPCVRRALTNPNAKASERCYFSAEVLDIPGIAPHSEPALDKGTVDAGSQKSTPLALTRVGGGVKAPRLVFNPEPAFTAEARRIKYRGTAVLGLVVDGTGLPRDIHILTPLGCGLDEQAVRVLQTWKFEPAIKDGQPVAVEIAVEVDFHLY
jgi:TonB family protein